MSPESHHLARLLTVLFAAAVVALATKYGNSQMRKRKEHKVAGAAQKQLGLPKWACTIGGIVLVLLGILGIAVSATPGEQGQNMVGSLITGAVMVLIGIAFLVAAYFYWNQRVIVTPESITVLSPFHDTRTITHQNLISVEPKTNGAAHFLYFKYQNEGDPKPSKLRLEVRTFDLTDFFEGDPRWTSVLYSLQALQHGAERPSDVAQGGAAEVGELFTIPVDAERAYVAQVVALRERHVPFIVVFDFVGPRYGATPDPVATLQAPVLLTGATKDTNLVDGVWATVGKAEAYPETIVPAYLTGDRTNGWIHSFTDGVQRPAQDDDFDTIRPLATVEPHVFEAALQAHEGLIEPTPETEELAHPWPTSMQVFGQI